ncbi:3078_t:CDS:2 [Entrophospora sp. SA101]|nr:3078_t:CDS:2 [Entrophospora sp. SA101]
MSLHRHFVGRPSINRKISHPFYNKKGKKIFYNNKEEEDDGFDNFENYKISDDKKFDHIEEFYELFPVDDKSMSIMETAEILSQYLWNGKFSSPVKERLKNGGATVIDIGCGPATWLTFMAEEFPKSTFVGIDIVIDLNDSKKELPGNLALIRHDILDGLPFPDDTFDFVHQKHMTQSLTIDQWSFVIDELIRITKPGVMPYGLGPVGKRYMVGYGIIRESIEQKLINADEIIEITDQARNFPLGGDGMAGEMVRTTIVGSLENAGPYISTFIGVSLEEYNDIIEQCAVENLKYKPYIKNFR